MSSSTPHSHIEALIPNVMILGGWGLGEIIRSWEWGPKDGVSALKKRDTWQMTSLFLSLSLSVGHIRIPHKFRQKVNPS